MTHPNTQTSGTASPAAQLGASIFTDGEAVRLAFAKSAHHVLSTMMQIQVQTTPALPADASVSRRIRCSSSISGAATGSVSLAFGAAPAEAIVTLFTGARAAAGTPAFADALRELTGMICSTFCALLADGRIQPAQPEVTIGVNDPVAHPGTTITLLCSTDIADFTAEIALTPIPDAHA